MPRISPRSLAVLVDAYPKLSETFVTSEVAALRQTGHVVRIEARTRPIAPQLDRAADSSPDVAYAFDDTLVARLRALARLATRHPVRCLCDLLSRRRWLAEEDVLPLRVLAPIAARLDRAHVGHVHAHFATGPALDALRLARLLRITSSVIAHGFDVFQQPRNLRDKLTLTDLALAPCEYTADHLRKILAGDDPRVEVVTMGVDGSRFHRSIPYRGSRRVLAVGRLVEKKGFMHLIEAAARLEDEHPLDAVTIIGEGPLRAELEQRVRTLGVEHRVVLAGAGDSASVRVALDSTDLFVMPCVVALDGDRDAMPVVVKEALAMEVPVVASDEVGLPEIIRNGWGRLTPPGDPEALARAIAEVLAIPADRRAQMGRAGREHVLAHFDVRSQAAMLSALIWRLPAPAGNRRRAPTSD